ncbi:hypothetical protein F5Y04DRAFT_290353 [Hypomontagnella monticulosa]|nr:hypothetical protein F5Y04DRAFT_290353 [Hypomontagnella monticulosa]
MALKASASVLKRIVSNIEVEHKFNPGPMFSSYIANNTWHLNKEQPTQGLFSVVKQPHQVIRDTYYDTEDGLLGKLGLWVRQRHIHIQPGDTAQLLTCLDAMAPPVKDGNQPHWNAKSRLGGHYSSSQFVELYGKADVAEEVMRITKKKMKLEDLRVVSDLQTRRCIWKVKELSGGKPTPADMTIVIDDVTEAKTGENEIDQHPAFSHTVGEIEFAEDVITEDKGDAEHEAYRKEVAELRRMDLMKFMLEHPELFSITPKPVGKLTAYDLWRAARDQAELVKSRTY